MRNTILLCVCLCLACGSSEDVDAGGLDAASDVLDGSDGNDVSPDAGLDGASDPCDEIDCADDITCTVDSCFGGACAHEVRDGLCSAAETCSLLGGCEAGEPCAVDVDCPEPDPCRVLVHCDTARGLCQYLPFDGDMDGDPAIVCGGSDCDDSTPAVRPGADEVCDGADNDCDGFVDGAGVTCPAGFACLDGACSCPAPLTDCGAGCVDTTRDPRHCGGCRVGCFATEACVAGACVCPAGTLLCGSECADTTTDAANCGACGLACPTGGICVSNVCGCAMGTEACGGGCVDLSSDLRNCGACGNVCVVGATCGGGTCRPDVLWGRAYYTTGDIPEVELERVGVTSSGEIVVTGAVSGSLREWGGAIVISGVSSGAYVAKWTSAGVFDWLLPVNPSTTIASSVQHEDVVVDESDDILWGGRFGGYVEFGPGGVSLTSTTGIDGVVAKIGPTGTALWANRIFSGGLDEVLAVTSDGAGGLIAAGWAAGDIDTGGGIRPAGTSNWGFLAHYGTTGSHVASWRLPGRPLFVERNAAGEIVVAGYFDGTVDFGDGPVTAMSRDTFIARYSATGVIQRTIHIPTAPVDIVAGLAVTSTSIYVATSEALVARYAYDGVLGWTTPATTIGAGTAEPRGLTLTPGGDVIVVGGSNGDYVWGTGPAPGFEHGFVARFDPTGALDWAAQMRSGEAVREAGFVHGVDVNASGTIGIAGNMVSGLLAGSLSLPDRSRNDQLFVIRMSDPVP